MQKLQDASVSTDLQLEELWEDMVPQAQQQNYRGVADNVWQGGMTSTSEPHIFEIVSAVQRTQQETY